MTEADIAYATGRTSSEDPPHDALSVRSFSSPPNAATIARHDADAVPKHYRGIREGSDPPGTSGSMTRSRRAIGRVVVHATGSDSAPAARHPITRRRIISRPTVSVSVAALAALCSPVSAQTTKKQAEALVAAYYKKQNFSAESIEHRKLAARTVIGVAEKLGTSVGAAVESARLDTTVVASEAEGVLVKYHKRQADLALAYGIWDANSALVQGALLATGPIAGPISVIVWENTADAIVQWSRKEEEGRNKRAFALALDQLGAAFTKKLASSPPADRAALMESKIKETSLLDSAPAEVRGKLQANLMRQAIEMNAVNANAIAAQGKQLAQQGETLAKQGQQLDRVQQALATHTRSTAENFRRIGTEVADIQASVAALQQKTGQNSQDIQYMQGLLWGQLSIDQRLAALKTGGFFREMSPVERDAQIDLLKAQKARADLVRSVDSALQTTAAFVSAAKALGIDSPALNELGNVVAKGEVLFASAMAASTGNPVAILNAVTSIAGLFSDSPDPDAVRHAQIMGELREIKGLQIQTLQEVRAVQEQLKVVLQLQAETLRQVTALRSQLDEVHRDTVRRIEQVNANVLENITITTELGLQGVDQCRLSLSSDRAAFGIGDITAATYESLYPWLSFAEAAGTAPRVASCTTWLLWTLERKAGDWYFRVRSATNPEVPMSGEGDALRQLYLPMLDVFSGLRGEDAKPVSRDAALAALMLPSTNVSELDRKWKAVQANGLSVPCHVTLARYEKTSARCSDESNQHSTTSDYLQYPYYLAPIEEAARHTLATHIFPAYFRDRKPIGVATMNQVNPDGLVQGRKMLSNMLRRVDVAVSQRSLLHGDLLLPALHSRLQGIDQQLRTGNDAERLAARRYLLDLHLLLDRTRYGSMGDDSLVLPYNFVVYTLASDMRAGGINLLQYQLASSLRNTEVWKQLSPSPLEFVFAEKDSEERDFSVVKRSTVTGLPDLDPATGYVMETVRLKPPKGWSVRFNRQFVRIPSMAALQNGALMLPGDTLYLQRLRAELFEQLSAYGFLTDTKLSTSQAALVQNALLREALARRVSPAK